MKKVTSLILTGSALMLGLSQAATITISATAPIVDGADIANNNGAVDAGGDLGHIWFNRPLQGQTFTTGNNVGGYLLNAVTLQNLNNTIAASPVFEVIVGAISGSVLTQIGSTETGVSGNYVPLDYLTFNFATPLSLGANTTYGFLWDTGSQGFVTVNNLDDTSDSGGTALSSGAGNTPDFNNVILRNVDRVFHLDLEALTPTGVAEIHNSAATSITTNAATLNGEVLDIGDDAPAITIRWGDEDGGSDPGLWDHAEALPGTRGVGPFSATTSTTLAPNTTCYFTAFASNSAGDSVASPSLSFTTPPAAPTVSNIEATNIDADQGEIGGTVTDNGRENPTLYLYWGTADAGTNAGAWQNSILLGAQGGNATTNLTGLSGGTTYFFRAFVINIGGSA